MRRVEPSGIHDAFAYCEQVAKHHYENFPVASLFIPGDLRPYIWSVYAFARAADDVADEGDLPAEERLKKLDDWQRQLDACYAGNSEHPVFIALAETATKTGIPRQLLSDLLTAFRMDVTVHRYRTFQDLLGYCRCSANPVGRLVLQIFGEAGDRTASLSDFICSALQLTNFWQDCAGDVRKGRMYIPLEDMERFGYTEEDLARGVVDSRFRELMKFQVDRTHELFRAGEPLLREVTRRLRFELTLTVSGGRRILQAIRSSSYDVLRRRPTLSAADRFSIIASAFFHTVV